MHRVSVRRAAALLCTAIVYTAVLVAVCLQIIWPCTHDGALSPSELAARRFNPLKHEMVWIAGTVKSCHEQPGTSSVVYILADEVGKNPARVSVEWRSSDGTTYSPGVRVGFSGERTAPTVVVASTDLFRVLAQ